jgi:transcriptional regulator with XRE-family HTH domain
VSESLVELERDHEIDVGERLRAIRHLRRLTLRDVAERAGVSESFVSQVERGKASPSVASLQRLAGALGMAVSDLFSPDGTKQPRLLRRDDRVAMSFGRLGAKSLLTPKPFHSLEVVAAEFEPGGSTGDEPYAHGDSEELFIVLAGRVHLQLGTELLELGEGDCAHYRSSTLHRVLNVGDERAEVLFVVSPPSY